MAAKRWNRLKSLHLGTRTQCHRSWHLSETGHGMAQKAAGWFDTSVI